MPTLDWIGKKAVVNHHREVPYRLLHCDKALSAGAGDGRAATLEVEKLAGKGSFGFPKDSKVIADFISLATEKDSLILDSFAGSGTTGHATLALNQADGGSRRFILVEMDENICQKVTAQRLTRVIEGYGKTAGLGGGYRFCTLGEPLFDEFGQICADVKFPDLAAHIFFTETGMPIPKRANSKTPLLGVHEGKAIYLLFNGVLGDKRPNGGNVLTGEVLRNLPTHDGPKIIYGESCRLGADRLRREGVVFKQVPYEIKVS
jgi:adenine-specific DNA-methyltransferase